MATPEQAELIRRYNEAALRRDARECRRLWREIHKSGITVNTKTGGRP